MHIRQETDADAPAIAEVNERAFAQTNEARLVEALRRAGAADASLVAVEDGRVVGHILFTPVTIQSGTARIVGAGLGPVAVLPDFQRRGVGSALVEAGSAECRRMGKPFVAVLGGPAFYRRFGFETAARFGVRCEFDAPEECFMLKELAPDALGGAGGTLRYRPEFSAV